MGSVGMKSDQERRWLPLILTCLLQLTAPVRVYRSQAEDFQQRQEQLQQAPIPDEPVFAARHPVLSRLRPTRTNVVMASLPSWLRYFHQSFLREWLTNAVPTTEPPPAPALVQALSTNSQDLPPDFLSSGHLFSNLKYEGKSGDEKPRRGQMADRATPPTLHSVFSGPFSSPLPRLKVFRMRKK